MKWVCVLLTLNRKVFSIMYRMSGEDSEMRLCDAKSLSMTTLRMTAEAKVCNSWLNTVSYLH